MSRRCIMGPRQSGNTRQPAPAQGSDGSHGFRGFDFPAVAVIPDIVFRELLWVLGEPELRAFLYLLWRTFGLTDRSGGVSVGQFLAGTLEDGRAVDSGCGIRERAVLDTALQSLEERGILHRQGDVCSLKSVSGGRRIVLQPPHINNPSGWAGESDGGTAPEEAEGSVAEVTRQLIEFGLAAPAAEDLARRFPPTYVLDKLGRVEEMIRAGSPLVNRNPQGYLRRAIEEDYTSPGRFGAAEAKVGCLAKTPGWNTEKGHRRKAKRALLPAGELVQIWQRALAFLRLKVSRANYEVWLQDTVLLHVDEAETLVGCPTVLQRDWLEGRMKSLIKRALAEVLGRDVEVAFTVVASGGDTDEAA